MPTIALTFVPRLARKARLRFDRHSGEHMIVYPERGLALNESAAAIAKKCDGARTVATIIEELASESESHEGGGRETIEKDVIAFLSALAQKGLLEP